MIQAPLKQSTTTQTHKAANMLGRPVLSSVSITPSSNTIQCRDAHTISKVFRQATRPSPALFASKFTPSSSRLTPLAARFISAETKTAIEKAVGSAPVVLFMKGTPEAPQCGFSKATIQILGLQGVDPAKFTAFNVLEDQSLRQGLFSSFSFFNMDQRYCSLAWDLVMQNTS